MDISSLLPLLISQQKGGDNNNLTALLPALMGGNKGGGDMSGLLMNMLQNNNQKQEAAPQKQNADYDTNPHYLKRYYNDKDSFEVEKQAQPQKQGAQNDLLGMLGANSGGGLNPMSLLSMLNSNKSATAKTQSVNVNANLTKPIEVFAPSNIVINIRRMMQ